MSTSFVFNILNWLKIPSNLNLRWLKIFIFLAVFGNFILIIRVFEIFDYYFLFQFNESDMIIKFILVFWFAISISILFYPKNYFLGILNLIISATLLRGFLTYGIFEATHLCISWALLFSMMYLNGKIGMNKQRTFNASLGLFFTIIFFGFIFFHAGYDKLIDPYWQSGIGFLNFIELEWILSEELRNFYTYSYLPWISNYFTIISEMFFLFLFVFPNTRRYSLFLYVPLGFQLLFPLNIFLIGYFAAIFSLPIFIISFGKSKIKNFNKESLLYVFIIIFVAIGFVNSLRNWHINFFNGLDAPKTALYQNEEISYNFSEIVENNESYSEELIKKFQLKEITNPRRFITNRYLRFGPIALFSSIHTVGTYVYKVEICNSSNCDVINYFEDDGSRGLNSGFLELNAFQSSMYTFGDLVYASSTSSPKDFKTLFKKKFNSVIFPLSNFSGYEFDSEKTFHILIRPVGKDCLDQNWVEYLEIKDGIIKIKPINVTGCDQGRNPYLKNYLKYRL